MDPWTLYWRSDRPQSCIPTDAGHRRQIDDYWVRFARTLRRGARLVDLATGNGAVPLALRRAGLELAVTGVDRADIDPCRYLADPAPLADVRFLGGVDLAAAGALPERFDAVTSQFGIEYLPAPARAPAVARALDTGGRFQLLTHHAASDVVAPRRRDLDELRALQAPDGLLDRLDAFARRAAPAQTVEAAGRDYLQTATLKTRRLSGAVLAAVEGLLDAAEAGDPAWHDRAAALRERVQAETLRLTQLVEAALDADAATALAEALQGERLTVSACEPLRVGSGDAAALVGWHIAGQRP